MTEPVIISDLLRVDAARGGASGSRSSESADDSRDEPSDGASSSGRRRYGNARLRAMHKAKAKAAAGRTGSTRVAKHDEQPEPRVLPLPQPSERQLRTKAAAMGQPAREPLNLAPDPYDQNR